MPGKSSPCASAEARELYKLAWLPVCKHDAFLRSLLTVNLLFIIDAKQMEGNCLI